MLHSLMYLLIALGQQSLAQNDGLGSISSSFGFDSTFDTAVPEDPTASMVFVEPDVSLQCPVQPYQSYLFSQNPPVVYVASFVNDDEARHLIQQSGPNFAPAFVYGSGQTQVDQSSRKSHTALPDRDDVVRCLEQRARKSQEWEPGMTIEAISVQRYEENGFFTHHYDAFGETHKKDRKTTLNVFLQANCTGGGTHFPYLPRPDDERWCQFIDCDSDLPGVTFKPIAGNAVFWENIRPDGTVHPETLHAGMPVLSGTKIGMNIWTWTKERR
ncbi:hypothetical protein BDV38DRAFT_280296 [Aspergillus pseudotamarii]|uniref:Fe2OG dioxygenase domain-containing protein n=1 Tax=Aspergillus pseudotamarii TaxID=132259 RepID=A0A5N6T1Z4_ASPPS|nr:uncharacterized protein BDV38DRAFT_280296 [Aspergillus pseudotamarii]KAE8140300.1 hypothetical protein BDV38DRAFT_280296 [Aspergillus pseudotamarii]